MSAVLTAAAKIRTSALLAASLPSRYRLYIRYKIRYRNFTMVQPPSFFRNLDLCLRLAPKSGCIVECGVWRGGMSAAIAEILPGRVHFLFDSFEGLPSAKEIDGEAAIAYQRDRTHPYYYNNCRAERSFAERAMSMSAAGSWQLVQGWFADTLPSFTPTEPIAVLRLDGDWYDSTMQSLENLYLYPHVVPGGLILVDDYYTWDGCARAIHDFLSSTKSVARIRNRGGSATSSNRLSPASSGRSQKRMGLPVRSRPAAASASVRVPPELDGLLLAVQSPNQPEAPS